MDSPRIEELSIKAEGLAVAAAARSRELELAIAILHRAIGPDAGAERGPLALRAFRRVDETENARDDAFAAVRETLDVIDSIQANASRHSG